MKRKTGLSIVFILPLFLIFNGCKHVAKFEEAAEISAGLDVLISPPPPTGITFSGISSIDQKTDTTLRLNWAAHADAVAYDIFTVASGSPIFLTTVFGQASSALELTSLNPSQLYTFRVRAKDSEGNNDSNTTDISVTMNLAPEPPSELAKILPVTSSDYSLPTVRVSGVKNGDVITLFTDSTCTTPVASGTASGSTIDLTPTSLNSGMVNLYASATNAFASASDCSTSTISYEKLACPTANGSYIAVNANPTVGTNSEFCVAQYEMKHVGGVAISQAAGNPWVNINYPNSVIACTNLGPGYGLISNEEWMTIAREIEMTPANWSNGAIGDDHLNRGWSASMASDGFQNLLVAPSTGPDCLYNTGANVCAGAGDHKLKRTHTLANGEIWDFAGNVSEWTGWIVNHASKAYDATDGAPQEGWREWTLIDTNINNGDQMETITWQSTNPSFDSTKGIGQYYAGNGGDSAARRGGYWLDGSNAGVFSLRVNWVSVHGYTDVGFRCVFRP